MIFASTKEMRLFIYFCQVKHIVFIFLIPIIVSAQNSINIDDISSKKLALSFHSGTKIYSGNMLLENRKFTREGVFFAFNFFTRKEISKKINIISKSSFILSNAIAKEIDVHIPETEIDFVTQIPNILSCNINYSITLNKPINRFLVHGLSLEFRIFPLFYKKGRIFNASKHSFGGYVSSEENGSLPDLEKSTQISYSINYAFNNITSASILIFIYSDLSLYNYDISPLYPGISIKFEKIINPNFRAPWIRIPKK